MQTLYLLYLDRHHLGDEVFLNSLAKRFSSAGPGAPASLLVHGSGEKVERTLEAQGYFPDRTDGVLDVDSEEQRRLVERAVREVNQELVATLTDEVVSTVGIQGVDRGLLQQDADGTIRADSVGWVSALVKQHVLPVISALVEVPDTGTVREIAGADVVGALARALADDFDPVACVFTTADTAGLPDPDGTVLDTASVESLTDEHLPEPSAVRHIAEAGIPVLVTNLQGFFAGEEPEGTQVRA